MSLLAYHNDPAIKEEYLTRVRKHREADQLVQGYGYWHDGKGCAVGCTIHGANHAKYEELLGIPGPIAYLEDAIFEGLPMLVAREWPEKFLTAIPTGKDLSLVYHEFCAWLLRSDLLTITDGNRAAVNTVADLHDRVSRGEAILETGWSAARSAADSAAWSAACEKMAAKLLDLLAA